VALLISTGPTRTRELLSVTPLYISAEKGGILPDTIRKAASQFNKAIKEHSEEMHLESIREFEELVNDHPNPKYDVQLLLFIGAYYEYLDEHLMAIETFDRVLMRYPRSGLASIAQCAIGIIYEEKLNDMAAAKEAYEKVISRYPRSAEVEEATAGLGRLSK
jgi:tetratricopeptide (TPR) repeat protein